MLDTQALTLNAIRNADEGDDHPDSGGNSDGQNQIGVATKTRAKPKKPSQFKVLLLNDDYTPMEFVVIVLKRFFQMDMEAATRVMLTSTRRASASAAYSRTKWPKPRSIK